jgi:hypothetical protein
VIDTHLGRRERGRNQRWCHSRGVHDGSGTPASILVGGAARFATLSPSSAQLSTQDSGAGVLLDISPIWNTVPCM